MIPLLSRLFPLVLLLICLPALALASDSKLTADSLARLVQRLHARVEVLEYLLMAATPPAGPELVSNGAQPLFAEPVKTEAVEDDESLPLEISGFLDAVAAFELHSQTKPSAGLNQVEVDLARDLSSKARAELALCFQEEFSLGAATLQYQLTPAMALRTGQFDVPFGLDYHVYGSFDRRLITPPSAVTATHGGWNDLGIQASLSGAWGALDLYAVRGFESHYWAGKEPLPPDVADDDARWVSMIPDVSGGLRLNLIPQAGLEAGISAAAGWDGSERSLLLGGVHVQQLATHWAVKGEGIIARRLQQVAPQLVRGGYLEGMVKHGRFFLLQRLDYVAEAAADSRAWSLGVGAEVTAGLEVRSEYRVESQPAGRQLRVQVAAGF